MRTRAGVLILLAVVIAAGVTASSARADGDPASDALITEEVFYPYSSTVSEGLQKTLNAETSAASRSHFPIKVALIASPADLGSVTELFGQPQKYADFLGREISYFEGKQLLLLVVMPFGYGVRGLSPPAALAAATLKKPTGNQSDDLARAAIVAVAKLAIAAGYPIKNIPVASPAHPSPAHPSNGWTPPIAAILALAAITLAGALLAFRQRRAGHR
jgi:hypothetical protein